MLNLIIPAAAVGLCAVVPLVSCTASVPWMSRVTVGEAASPILNPLIFQFALVWLLNVYKNAEPLFLKKVTLYPRNAPLFGVDAVSFKMSTGNIDSGQILLFGLS